MVIIRDNNGNVIGKQASERYVPTRKLRNAHEQRLCDKAMGIERPTPTPSKAEQRLLQVNLRRVQAGLEPVYNDAGVHYGREDEACC